MSHTDAIAHAFNKAASTYDEAGQIQRITADRLAKSLDPWRDWVPAGAVLELGAGSGFLTKELIRLYPKRKLVITDISEKLLAINRQKHAHLHEDIHFELMDAQDPRLHNDQPYALITHNFMLQWTAQPEQSMIAQSKVLMDGGLILCCFPGERSFPEWHQQALRHGAPMTANALPNAEKIGIAMSFEPVLIDLHEDEERVQYDSALGFFKHFKKIGAHTRLKPTKSSNSPALFKKMIQNWPKNALNKVHITYHTSFMAIKKDG